MYYLHPDYEVPVAACQAKEVQNGLYELVDYPAKGFAIQLTSVDKCSVVADAVFKVVQFLADNQVAHNVFITRGASLDGQRYGNIISTAENVLKLPPLFCVACNFKMSPIFKSFQL